MLVSFKNIPISQVKAKNGAHAHTWAYFFDNNSAIFGPIGLNILWELRRLLDIDRWL